MNFVKSHGQDAQKFITKQGLDRAFYECENRMWRFGRRSLPNGIRLDGGSDWIALTHQFSSYLIFANNSLLRGLKQIYDHTLLPAEVSSSSPNQDDLLFKFYSNHLSSSCGRPVLLPHGSEEQRVL